LEALLRIAEQAAAPLALAVIPAAADAALAERISASDGVDVLQHGWAHRNHEPGDRPKSEFGPSRAAEDALADLDRGLQRIKQIFGAKALPVLAPPWNRIDAGLVARLPALGIRGLSTFKPRGSSAPDEPTRVNTHVDIVDWRGGRRFVGDGEALDATADHLERRRKGVVDTNEPTGILSHHLSQDDGCAAFLGRLAALVTDHRGAAWVPARKLFSA
jgi:peptidoglycan/xylan/chitin deacetylase (PgdA/CDA1 family)